MADRSTTADAALEIERLHAEGLEAYAEFVRLTSDVMRLGGHDLTRVEVSQLHSLPNPVAELPICVTANVAAHVVDGLLAFTGRLRGPDDPEPLRKWVGEHRVPLGLLCPETFFQPERRWLWKPPPSTPAFEPGHLTLAQLSYTAAEQRRLRWENSADGHVLAFCLVRDWFVGLTPLLRALDANVGALLASVVEAAAADVPGPSFDEVRGQLDVITHRFDVAESPWSIFLALARSEALPSYLGMDSERVDAVFRDLAASGSKTSATAPAREPQYRPSTTIASDLWTTDDVLGYRPYAEALAAFICDPRTTTPLTVGIKAPWGAGKTSLMRMVAQELARGAPAPPAAAAADRLTTGDVIALAGKPPEVAARDVGGRAPRQGRAVWFNAWKYQSGEQLWAGLAHAIVEQVTRDMSAIERERFWATINFRRVDPGQVRRRIHEAFLQRLARWAVIAPAALVAAGATALLDTRVGGGLGIAAALGVAAGIGRQWQGFVKEEAVTTVPGLVRDPGYDGRLGFLHLVHEDLKRILDLVATPERPLVVFVDDLDRCSYSTVAQVIEALNVFLSGELANCVFIIAMEPDLVAAQIHVAYEKLFDRIEERAGPVEAADLGWRFLEKMVQLPLALPPPDASALDELVGSLATRVGPAEPDAADALDTPGRMAAVRELLTRRRVESAPEGARPSLAGLGGALAEASASAQPGDREILQRVARDVYQEEFDDRNPEVQSVVAEFRPHLGANPREIKRFINVFRFYAYVLFWRETAGAPSVGLRGAGKLATLAIRAPEVLGLLGLRVLDGADARRPLLALLEDAGADDPVWDAALARVAARPLSGALSRADLRALITAEPKVGDIAGGFL
ncbi:KAP family P-loop NTPase fold protein [Baekduia sp. Peel2402]|uniref:KAP family P-loop NTPase fold protein n=1 Tax=Baekduia sp. Peel2402 TaxID=3458296 RepID=UPI00403ECBB7